VFDSAIDREQAIKLILSDLQKRAIFEGVPSHFVDGSGISAKELLDARIYAFVNEDAHSRI
jgi:hypothetical protein